MNLQIDVVGPFFNGQPLFLYLDEGTKQATVVHSVHQTARIVCRGTSLFQSCHIYSVANTFMFKSYVHSVINTFCISNTCFTPVCPSFRHKFTTAVYQYFQCFQMVCGVFMHENSWVNE